jgi:hypothetical protein
MVRTNRRRIGIIISAIPCLLIGVAAPGAAQNRPPVANEGHLRTPMETPATARLSGSDPDGDALTFTVSIQAIKGRVEITNGATGDFRYTPDPLVAGADLFWFKVSDGRGVGRSSVCGCD